MGRAGIEQLLRIFDYLAFESDAEMPAVRCVADLIWKYLGTLRPTPKALEELKCFIQI